MSGYSTGYTEETIGLRGYENGSLAYIMDMLTTASHWKLRYPFMLGNTTIYVLDLLKQVMLGHTKYFNPFDMEA